MLSRQFIIAYLCSWYSHAERKAKHAEAPMDSIVKTLHYFSTDPTLAGTFPFVYTILLAGVTIPVTSCECERSNSVLRRIKTYLRSTMTSARLNATCRLHIYYDYEIQNSAVIGEFLKRSSRRSEFARM